MTTLHNFAHEYVTSGWFSTAERIEDAIRTCSINEVEAAIDYDVIRFWDSRKCAELIRACALDGNRPEVVKALHELLEDSNTDELQSIHDARVAQEEAERLEQMNRRAA